MLPSLLKSSLPHRFLFPPRRRFRDRPAAKVKSEVSIVRLLSFFFGGILLANGVLMTSAAFRSQATQPLPAQATAKRGPAAAVAAGQTPVVAAAAPVADTDGRAVPEAVESPPTENRPQPRTVMIDKRCAEHARDKLLAGLAQYYLHRQLLPGATSDGLADTTAVTGLFAELRDPATAPPEASCKG